MVKKKIDNKTVSVEAIRRMVVPILKEFGVMRAAIFGSVAENKAGRRSDIDLLIELEKDCNLFDFIDLKMALEEATRRKVDVVEYDAVKPAIRNRVLASQVVIL